MTITELIEALAAVAFTGLTVTAGVIVARTTTKPLRLLLIAGVLLLALVAILRGDHAALTALGAWLP